MSDLLWLTDGQMERLRPFFPKSRGKPRVDDRPVLSGRLRQSERAAMARRAERLRPTQDVV